MAGKREGWEAGSPLTPGPKDAIRPDPPEKSFLDPSTFQPLLGWFYSLMVQPGHCLWQPHSPALVSRPQRHLARLREACGGRGLPGPVSQPLL